MEDIGNALLSNGCTFLRLVNAVVDNWINSLKSIDIGDLTEPNLYLTKWGLILFVILAIYLVLHCMIKTVLGFFSTMLCTLKGISVSLVLIIGIFLAYWISLKAKEM